jgi:translation initiation factor 4B
MMKSWADCSSDEESVDEIAGQPDDQNFNDPETESAEPQEEAPPVERIYDFPDKPPFTAFVGNLAFSVVEADDLKAAVSGMALERLGQEINVIGGKVAYERRDGKHRGFGYVEVETLEEVRILHVTILWGSTYVPCLYCADGVSCFFGFSCVCRFSSNC